MTSLPLAASTPAAAAPRAARYDIYKPIHKALRRQMCEALLHIGEVDAADAGDFAAALGRIDDLCLALRSHVAHEDGHLRPALEAAEPGASHRTSIDHDHHLADLAALEAETGALRHAAPAARPAGALQLYRHLALFVAENFEHMHIEETAHNTVLWAGYDDAQIAAIEGAILAGMSPEENLQSLRGIARAVSVQELAELLGAIRAQAPAQVFQGLLAALQPDHDARRWAAAMQALGVPALPA